MNVQRRPTANQMRGDNTRLFVILFGAALIIGLVTGRYLLRGEQPASSKWLAKNPATLSNSQMTILIAGVDDLTQLTVILEQAWLVTLDMQMQTVHLEPLYPGHSPQQQPGAMFKPHSPLLVQTTDFESLKSLETLASQAFDWDYSVYMDTYALSSLIELASGTEPDLLPEDISSLLLDRVITWQDPINASHLHSSLVQFICAHQQPFSDRNAINAVKELTGEHILTDMPKRQANKILDAFSDQAGQFECIFPDVDAVEPAETEK